MWAFLICTSACFVSIPSSCCFFFHLSFLRNIFWTRAAHSRDVCGKASPQRQTKPRLYMGVCLWLGMLGTISYFLLSFLPSLSLSLCTSFSSYYSIYFRNIKLKIHQRKCEKGKTLHERIVYAVAMSLRSEMRCSRRTHTHTTHSKQNKTKNQQNKFKFMGCEFELFIKWK